VLSVGASSIEWGGDVLVAAAVVAIAVGLTAYGYAWPRWRALGILAVLWATPLLISDALYFGFDVETLPYCGEPDCDPGPLPASLGLAALPVALGLAAAGLKARRRGRQAGAAGRPAVRSIHRRDPDGT